MLNKPVDFLVAVCNARGADERVIRKTWTFRRTLHAYIVLSAERAWWVPMLMGAIGGVGGGIGGRSGRGGRMLQGGSGQRQRAQLPRWYRRRARHMTVIDAEDDLGRIAAHFPLGQGKAGQGRKIKRKG